MQSVALVYTEWFGMYRCCHAAVMPALSKVTALALQDAELVVLWLFISAHTLASDPALK